MILEGTAALVTGGASGLGRATAEALAARGARVTVLDSNIDGAETVAKEIGGFALACNVADAGSMSTAIGSARSFHGPARILVHCAGIAPAGRIVGRSGPMALEDYRRTIEVNLIGTFNTLRLAAADMMGLEALEGGERGVVVLTASIAAWEGQIGQAGYASSKAGVIGMILPAAREFATAGIRVCGIAPGTFGTPMMDAMPEEVQRKLCEGVPFPPRFGRPAEFAALALAIVDNMMLNGEVIRLDGANRMAAR